MSLTKCFGAVQTCFTVNFSCFSLCKAKLHDMITNKWDSHHDSDHDNDDDDDDDLAYLVVAQEAGLPCDRTSK